MADSKSFNLADRTLLEKIDKLFTCGVGEHVNLPQLVVVGAQSSGKSSVLEGLTRLPFPRDKELCTRFATQITFKRSKHAGITASIIPAASASDNHKAYVSSWSRPGLTTLTGDDFATIILEAQDRMGLGKLNTGAAAVHFSEDVFKIEISGPDQEHFSIVDVPGIFKNPEAGKTTQADVGMVNRMVTGFMANPRSVMLAVVAANYDIANQEILSIAEEYDRDGIRTLGVLTKPDLVDEGAEEAVMELLHGSRYQLTLGWQVVRNTKQADLGKDDHDRDNTESRFFKDVAPWNTLDADKCGIRSLRLRLQDILARHIKREFPKVRSEVSERLRHARQRLQDLGVNRGTVAEQRTYLTDISMRFERLTSDALNTKYSANVFDEDQALRLPTEIMGRQDQFANDMRLHGHHYAFQAEEEEEDGDEPEAEHGKAGSDSASSNDETLPTRWLLDFPELEDCTIGPQTLDRHPKNNIMTWLARQHLTSRGFELGSIDPALVTTVFRGQSDKWGKLALGYVSDIIKTVHKFILTLLEVVCHDEQVQGALISKLADTLQAKYRLAFEHVKFLLRVERESIPMTANHYFNDNLEKSRQERLKRAAKKHSFQVTLNNSAWKSTAEVVEVKDLGKIENMSNGDHAVRDLHDVLRAYYKVALKRFVDSVSQQAALFYLVSGPDSPLKLFSAAYVSSLSDEELGEIAGEDPAVKEKRKALIAQIETLEEGRKAL